MAGFWAGTRRRGFVLLLLSGGMGLLLCIRSFAVEIAPEKGTLAVSDWPDQNLSHHIVAGIPYAQLLSREIDRLIDNVVALTERYGWQWSRTGAMIANLEDVFLVLDNGDASEAARQLSVFDNQVRVYMNSGDIPMAAGVPLLKESGILVKRLNALSRGQRLERLPIDGTRRSVH